MKPSKKASHKWTLRVKELLRGVRQARRNYLHSPAAHLKQLIKALKNQLKKELKQESRASWRRFLKEVTTRDDIIYNRGL